MGLFSGVSKAVSGLASSAKGIMSSPIGKLGMEALGTYFGMPGLGTAAGTMLGGGEGSGGSWMDMLGTLGSAALKDYSGNSALALERAFGQDAYNKNLLGIQMQNASAQSLQKQANDFNWQMNDQNNAFNQQQASFLADYQTSMSNTAHQREVADLKAAGLNPILSGTGGMGAGTPSAGMAVGSPVRGQAAPVRSEGDAVTSAFQAMTSMADAMKANSAVSYMNGAQTENTRAQTQKTAADTQLSNAQRIKTIYEAANALSSNPKIKQEVQNLKAVYNNLQKTGSLTDAQTKQVKQSTRNLSAIYLDLKMKGDISASDYGKLMEQINRSPLGEAIKLIKK